jgi:serine/threonine-protein kinase HipA
LALLLKTGWDTIGDVAVLPHGAPLTGHTVSVPESKLSEVSFWDLFYEGVGEHADAAVSGAQEKISSSTIAFGLKTAAVPSAILKLNPKNYPRLVQNEGFFLRMARACGLEASKATLVKDRDGEAGLLVRRFDRVKAGKAIRKLHQEDACQLLNIIPANKYSVSMRRIAEAVSHACTAPVVEIERIMRLYAFSYLIGNGDLHAKNISVFWEEAVRLTPAYDILSTLPYPLDRNMALQLEGRDDNFRTADFVAFGIRFGVPERATRTMIQALCERAGPWIERLDEIGLDHKTTEMLRTEIVARIAKLRR